MAFTTMPRFGLGTWRMGERKRQRAAEVGALRFGLELGVKLIDTAEMYGDGEAESIVGDAIAGSARDSVYIVSKCYPQNAGSKSMPAACERSLRRLRIERIDCYLLHWRGHTPLEETVATFERLVREGKIGRWGVSNFDAADMGELLAIPSGTRCAANQVLYHLEDRAVEWRLLELCRTNGIPLMAYSPLGQGGLADSKKLSAIAAPLHITPAQLALAFVLSRDGVVAIPKTASRDHLRENVDAAALTLDAATLAKLDQAFPPPAKAKRISVL
ncbi:MAG TPA: aldo/keto reductase [Casimicrobiaceae bacterium]|nr:aldo/keto reductase [Casimicrobiaceae bacterium]